MARIVTGSVADNVAPTEMASTKFISNVPGICANSQRINPITTADKKVPAKANVTMMPAFLKKLAWCSSYPQDRMMGGSSRLKKIW